MAFNFGNLNFKLGRAIFGRGTNQHIFIIELAFWNTFSETATILIFDDSANLANGTFGDAMKVTWVSFWVGLSARFSKSLTSCPNLIPTCKWG